VGWGEGETELGLDGSGRGRVGRVGGRRQGEEEERDPARAYTSAGGPCSPNEWWLDSVGERGP
jgi:hypothetical protein